MTGLVLWYPMHTSSTHVHDMSGHGNHGTAGSGVNQGAYGVGGLRAFDFPDSDLVSVPNGTVGTNDFTFSYWINHRGTTDNRIFRFDNDLRYIHGISDQSNNTDNMFDVWVDGTWQTDLFSVPPDTWTHIVGTYDSGTNSHVIYKDTDEQYQFNDAVAATGDGNAIGADDANTEHTDGRICDFRIYQRKITQAEIQRLYEYGNRQVDVEPPGQSDGGISYYEFDGDVTDSWGTNDGTDNTSETYESAIINNGKVFDGTDDYVKVDPLIDNISSGPFTFCAWAKLDSYNNNSTILGVNDDTGGNRFILATNNSTNSNRISLYENSSGTQHDIGIKAGLDVWMHYTLTMEPSATTAKVFVNGSQEFFDTGFNSFPSGTDQATIGAELDSGSQSDFMNGTIDEVRVYDRILSSEEINTIYRYGGQGIDMREFLVDR